MRRFYKRYSLWFLLLAICVGFLTLIIDFKRNMAHIIAIIMGAIGLLAVSYLAILDEKDRKKQKNEK